MLGLGRSLGLGRGLRGLRGLPRGEAATRLRRGEAVGGGGRARRSAERRGLAGGVGAVLELRSSDLLRLWACRWGAGRSLSLVEMEELLEVCESPELI